jgi:hypothetical protein
MLNTIRWRDVLRSRVVASRSAFIRTVSATNEVAAAVLTIA